MRQNANKWTLVIAVLLAGIGYSTTAAPARAFSPKEVRKYAEKRREKQKDYHKKLLKEQKKYAKKQQKAYEKRWKGERKTRERYFKHQRSAPRHYAPYAGSYPAAPHYVAPTPVYPDAYGVEYPQYYKAPRRGFGFGLDVPSCGFGFGFEYHR